MPYPSLTDYTEAVRDYPEISILDLKLLCCRARRGPNSQVESFPGGFSIVFPLSDGLDTFALRCWIRDIEDAQSRYQKISDYLMRVALPYFVDFEYVSEGILVNGIKWPITRMEWAEGDTLRQFIEDNLHDASLLRTTAAEFLKMVETLHAQQIAHGDLQDGNILIKRNGADVEIKLIDYDSLFVPALRGYPDSIVGLAEYQHPRRMVGGGTANERLDYFSELVIYLSLIALAEKPDLWARFGQRSEKGLLFVAEDFKTPTQSQVFRELEMLSPDVKLLTSKLKEFCAKSSIDQLEPLEALLPKTDPVAKMAYDNGISFLRGKRYNEAVAKFAEALGIDSKYKEAHYGLSLAYLQMENFSEAERAVKEALRIDANYQDARKLLDVIKQKRGAIGSNPIGSGSHAIHKETSDERPLQRHYIYLGLVVACVICMAFALVLNSKNKTLRDLQGQRTSQVNENQRLENENSGLLEQNHNLQGQLSDKDTQLTSLKNENKKLRSENARLLRRTQDFSNQIPPVDTKPDVTESEIQTMAKENERLLRQNQLLQEQLTQRETDLVSQTEKNQKLQNENKKLVRQNQDLQPRLSDEESKPAQTEIGNQTDTKPVEKVPAGKALQTLSGHIDWVRSLAFSPDGRTLASGSGDYTIRLWDVLTRRHKLTLREHKKPIISVAFSPDGRTLASGSADYTIRLWDVGTGRHKLTLKRHTTWVSSVAFSPDGRMLASGSGDRTIRLWDVATGMHKQKFRGHESWISSIAFSPDGQMLASGSADHTIRLWNVGTGKHKLTLSGHKAKVLSVVYCPVGKTLASGSGDGTIRFWDADSGKHKRTLIGHVNWVRSVMFSPDGQTLVSGGEDTTIRLWNVGTGKFKRKISGHSGPVVSVTFSPDGETIASGSVDGIRLWTFTP